MASTRPTGDGEGPLAGKAAAERLSGKPAPVKSAIPAIDIDPKNMEKVIAFVAERDEATSRDIVAMLNQAGVMQVTAQNDIGFLRNLMQTVSPDLIIVGDDVAPEVFDFIRDIRHSKIGANPFVLVTTLVASDNFPAVKRALQAGTDDIIVKPVKQDQLIQRLKRVTIHRQAFVVTSDYLGPDRRAKSRPSVIRRVNVLNTMLEKANGHDIQVEEIKAAVDGSMNDVLHARLDSHSYRLGFVCNLLIDSYQNNNITPETKDQLLVLVDVLKDAAKTAERVNEPELGLICGSLSKEVEGMAERYENPTERDLKLIQKLTRAVMLAVKPHASMDLMEQEAKKAAENYLLRKRGAFEKSKEIQRGPDDEPVETVDEPVMEIMPLTKGQILFKQGDPAVAAYIVASGSVVIYREIDGKKIPVSRIRKGQFFGEMAIIDGTPRRATAMAEEDCTLSLVSKEMIEEKMSAADPTIKSILHMLIDNIRSVPENFAPKPRSLADVATDLREQTDSIAALVRSGGSPSLASEATPVVERLEKTIPAILSLLEKASSQDPRSPARPGSGAVQQMAKT
ncbi:MAG: cyclic nucleotide-binding domain-containing protein [Rhodospirillaceae bacterium]|nr:cyclic nucleotide-binding domain-containing protein [Rhodospirillaceae bacterium]